MKLSAFGQALPVGGHDIALELVRPVVEAATAIGTTVTLDMEDHRTVDSTLAVLAELRKEHPGTGAVLQAMLFRTEDDAKALAVTGSRVRLVKGAYNEPADRRAPEEEGRRRRLRPLPGDPHGRPGVPDGRLARPGDGRARARAGRPALARRGLAGRCRCSTASAPTSSAGWPPPAPGCAPTCPTASTGTPTSCAGWPSARPTSASSSARSPPNVLKEVRPMDAVTRVPAPRNEPVLDLRPRLGRARRAARPGCPSSPPTPLELTSTIGGAAAHGRRARSSRSSSRTGTPPSWAPRRTPRTPTREDAVRGAEGGRAGLAGAVLRRPGRGVPQGRRPARRPVAADAQRRHHARPEQDRLPGRDRRGLRADRLLALQRALRPADPGRAAGVQRRASGTGSTTARSRASSTRSRRSTSPRSPATCPPRPR